MFYNCCGLINLLYFFNITNAYTVQWSIITIQVLINIIILQYTCYDLPFALSRDLRCNCFTCQVSYQHVLYLNITSGHYGKDEMWEIIIIIMCYQVSDYLQVPFDNCLHDFNTPLLNTLMNDRCLLWIYISALCDDGSDK